MGGECGTYEGQESFIQGFGVETCRKKEHLEDPRVDGKIIIR